ncbi:methyl-accepting chemotaxis protein [Paenibacillus sp. J2TS4]|uniref:methyl-accepting chemotaxis protein n=1 Tax=Paenibacillus sp. J2TS4 TaxID=2807194 RepID=UPI001BCA6FBB|nr:methyl-accepting chemotaxis protein [Paenibacillus sp. J2TS4]
MKLFLIFFFSIIVPVIFLGIFSYNISKEIIQDKVSYASEQTVHQATEKLDLVFQNIMDVTTQLFADSEFLRNLQLINYNTDEDYSTYELINKIQQRLNTLINSNNTMTGLYLLPTGDERLLGSGSLSTVRTAEIIEEEWFQQAVQNGGVPVWLPTKRDGYVGGDTVFGIARLLSKDYVILAEIRVNVMNSSIANIATSGGEAVIVDLHNNLVSVEDAELIGDPFEIDVNDDNFAYAEAVSKKVTLDGEEQLVVYKKMSATGWTVATTAPLAGLVKDTDKIWYTTLITVIVSTVIAILIGLYIVRMIGRPLVHLRDLMSQGAQGNLTVRIKNYGSDEIGEVSASFNQMMEQITRLVRQTNQSAADVLETAGVLLHSSRQTATSAKEIAIATEEIANGASSLAMDAEKGNSLTQEIGIQMKQVIAANVEMGSAAAEVHQAGEQGTTYMGELTTKTNLTEEMTRSMVEKVDKLKESTSSIRKILEVLQNLTKQTNILSLNATIEAARAGAAGKGFMVVADEIRKLADQSKQSIEVVGEITEKIQGEIDETVSVLSEAYPVFQEQIESVKEAELIFHRVQEHMGGFVEQLSAVTQSIETLEESQVVLHEAMTNVSAVSEESSATSEEVASLSNEQLNVSDELVKLSEKLEALSNSLKDSLSKFTI